MEELSRLVARSQAGDLDAYGQIVGRFRDMAYGYAYSIPGDFHLAEDAAQEAFLTAHRSLSQLREREKFPGWFRRIVFTSCQRLARSGDISTVSIEAAAEKPTGEADPAALAEKKETLEAILAAIKSLPEDERTATTLFYINGYSQAEIADFLDAPVTTVNNRMHASRRRLKERMINMVDETLKQHGPDERFARKVIEALLARPKSLEIEGHPVRRIWEQIQAAFPDYEIIAGSEVEDIAAFGAVRENMEQAYHVNRKQALRTQMSVTTLKAMRGRKPPVRLLAAGRVFRPATEDAERLRVFHQADGLCVAENANLAALKETVERAIKAVFAAAETRWASHDFGFVTNGMSIMIKGATDWIEVAGCGLLLPETLRDSGYDPDQASGFAFGLGLERLAMIKRGIKDIRELWRPPYAPEPAE